MTDDPNGDSLDDLADKLVNEQPIYLDLPQVERDENGDHNWINVAQFSDPDEALRYIRDNIDANCDERGRINLLVNMPDADDDDASSRAQSATSVEAQRDALLLACQRFFDAKDEDEKHHAMVAMEEAMAWCVPTPNQSVDDLVKAAQAVIEDDDDFANHDVADRAESGVFLARAVLAHFQGSPKTGGTITIEVGGGCLRDVSGLPEGWNYELHDYDNDPDDIDYDGNDVTTAELTDGTYLESPTPIGGEIRRYHKDGESLEVRCPGDSGYDEWLKLFGGSLPPRP